MKHVLLIFLFLTTFGESQILTPEEISAQIDAQKESADSADSQAVIAVLEEAKTLAEQLSTAKTDATNFQAKATAGAKPPELEEISAPAADASLEDLNAVLVEISSALEISRKRLSEVDSELDDAGMRILKLPGLVAEAREKMSEISMPPEGGSELAKAQRERGTLQGALLEANVERYQAEQTFLRSVLDSLPERSRLRKAHNSQLASLQKNLQTRVTALRGEEAENTGIALEKSFQELSEIPELAELITEVSQLNSQRTGPDGLQEKITDASSYDTRMSRLVRKIDIQESNARRRIALLESVGLEIDAETGIVLREQRADLQNTFELKRELRENVEAAVRSQVTLIGLRDKQAGNDPLSEKAIARILKENPTVRDDAVTELLEQRKSLLGTLISEHESLQGTLERANGNALDAINGINSYSTYLDQRLLWSRSTTPIQPRDLRNELGNISDLFAREMLEKAWASIKANWWPRCIPVLVLGLFFVFGLVRRRHLRNLERESSEQASKRNCTVFKPTVITIVCSALIAGTTPALFLLFAVLISNPRAYQVGLLNAGVFLFVTSLLYRFTKPAALFESHFKISPAKTKRIRNAMRCFIPAMLLLVFGIGALTTNSEAGASGRVVFMLTMLVVMMFMHQLFYPKHSILVNMEKSPWLSRLSYVLIVALPLSFLIGAALGYLSSVLTLRAQILATAGVLLGAFLVIRFFTRWILVSRRRLAIQQALQRREATLAERARKKKGELENEPDVASPEEVKAQVVNVVEVGQQTSQLLRYGVYISVFFALFSIWSTSLTALSVLDQKPLWPGSKPRTVETTASQSVGAMPGLLPQTPAKAEETVPTANTSVESVLLTADDFVSWQDLLLAIFVFLLTFVAARNIPGLLSLAVFSRLNLGPGGNFAFTTMVRYFIVLTGVVIGLNKVGITWDKVQWLAAAITLGIGFGLQEIFANFVAGLILLFERPIRLGDIVTVGDVSGKVTEIKIRATTIQQFNNRDLLVPNKDFITNQLTNWTLKDSILRFDLAVGIAYGSDTRKAEEILGKILKEHPSVLAEPAPQVIFETFGDSTLNFLLRAHVGQVGNLVKTQSDLHYQIDDAFRKAGIEIAFPQQDIHVRSLPDGVQLQPVGEK